MRALRRFGFPFIVVTVAFFLLAAMHPGRASRIHQAVKENDAAMVRQLIRDKVDVNERDEQGWTALHYASSMGNEEIIGLLIDAKANLAATGPDTNDTPLHFAVFNDHLKAVERLLAGGAGANAQNADGWTAMHLAVAKGQYEILLKLLAGGADVNKATKDKYGQCCALAIAAWHGQTDFLPILVSHGAKHPWLSRVKGFNPLFLSPIRLGRQNDGGMTVEGFPFVIDTYKANRPWRKLTPAEMSKLKNNYYCWAADKDNETKREGAVLGTLDENGQRASLKLAMPAYVGNGGVVYSPDSVTIAQGGPFVTVVVRAAKVGGSAERATIELRRGNDNLVLRADDARQLTAVLGGVQPYEPLTITFRDYKGSLIRVVETDCVYAGSSRGLVSIEVPADK